jgi:predicted transcriptional regulator
MNSTNEKKYIGFKLSNSLKNRIDELAKRKESNRSQVVREAIKIGLTRLEQMEVSK